MFFVGNVARIAPWITLMLLSACASTSHQPISRPFDPRQFARTEPRVRLCREYQPGLKVSFLNVGQGDAILLTCPDAVTQTLIDAGESSQRYPKAAEMFQQSFLSEMAGDSELEFAVNTHPDPDHLFGFASLLGPVGQARIPIGVYFDNGAENPHTSLENWIRQRLLQTGTAYINPLNQGIDSVDICPYEQDRREAVTLQFLLPSASDQAEFNCSSNFNDCSLVIKIRYGKHSLLLLADATSTWENSALQNSHMRSLLRSSIVKIGHHGSHSTTERFLELVDPNFAVISTGTAGQGTTSLYQFPQEEVLDRLNRFFENKAPNKNAAYRPLQACRDTGSGCDWDTIGTHPAIYSTARDGSISFFLTQNEGCIEYNDGQSQAVFKAASAIATTASGESTIK